MHGISVRCFSVEKARVHHQEDSGENLVIELEARKDKGWFHPHKIDKGKR